MQQALIVDDSKTAALALRKMLDRHRFKVDMVESGEEALEYLQAKTPDLIFMDHMMPGMDGFEAVKAIKSNPAKSAIPIVMHTTKAGEVYFGQARALGAADMLPKPASDQELDDVLRRLKERTSYTTITMRAITDDDLEQAPRPAAAYTGSQAINYHTETEVPVAAPSQGPLRQLLAALLLLAPVLWLLALYLPAEQQRQTLQQQQESLYKTVEWLLNQSGGYDYGDAPMGGGRLAILEGLVAQLAVADFQGGIRLEGHIGNFCLANMVMDDGRFVSMLPAAELPLEACDTIGFSRAQALAMSGRQSAEFKEYLASSPLLAASGITIEVVQFGAASPAYEYPSELDGMTVGDWNSAALRNNRVRFVIEPSFDTEEGTLWSLF